MKIALACLLLLAPSMAFSGDWPLIRGKNSCNFTPIPGYEVVDCYSHTVENSSKRRSQSFFVFPSRCKNSYKAVGVNWYKASNSKNEICYINGVLGGVAYFHCKGQVKGPAASHRTVTLKGTWYCAKIKILNSKIQLENGTGRF